MDELTVLVTGDYWHADFGDLIAKAPFSVTLRSIENILSDPNSDRDYRLVVIACSRRGLFDAKQIEDLLSRFVNVPVVTLLGSWCEGEERSGSPVPGLIRVYWHQWQGRIDRFVECLGSGQTSSWHLPKIATTADRALHESTVTFNIPEVVKAIGVSAQTEETYRVLQDALANTACDTFWIEGIDLDVVGSLDFSVLCVEANSLGDFTQQRVKELQRKFPVTPIVIILNFPRRAEYETAARLGISEIVSKPFQLNDLHRAVLRSTSSRAA